MTHALRSSVGPWSGGTAVHVIQDNYDGTVNVEIPHVKPSKQTGIDYEDLVFDIDKSEVVELRSRTREAPKSTRRERRAGKAQINNLIDKLSGYSKQVVTDESS